MNNRVAEMRAKLGYTQKALAEVLFVTPQAINEYEAGRSQPSVEVLSKMSQAFKVSIDYLAGIVDDPTPITRIKPYELTPSEAALIESLRSLDTGVKEDLIDVLVKLTGAPPAELE